MKNLHVNVLMSIWLIISDPSLTCSSLLVGFGLRLTLPLPDA